MREDRPPASSVSGHEPDPAPGDQGEAIIWLFPCAPFSPPREVGYLDLDGISIGDGTVIDVVVFEAALPLLHLDPFGVSLDPDRRRIDGHSFCFGSV